MNSLKSINLPLALLVSMTIAGACTTATNAATITTNYAGSSENFPNPERGFSIDSLTNNQNSPLSLSYLQQVRGRSITLVRRVYLIPQFRYSALSQSFLSFVTNDFVTARKAGVKLVVRFAYSWDSSGHDTYKDRVLSHLDQLRPVFQANQDVIAYVEAGFIGAWGEWHSSSNGLDNSQDKRAILSKILSVLPAKRMVALRYSQDKTDAYYNNNPLTPQEAFNGTYRARTGAHNDCFLSSANDSGTYNASNPDRTKTFLSFDNRYLPQGGETCRTSSYDDCPNALRDLQRMHWSQLNSDFDSNVISGWQRQGCLGEIKNRLGYRFRLLSSVIPDKVRSGSIFSMSFKIVNDGWASPYNPRNLEVVLRNRRTGNIYRLSVNADPRKWMPSAIQVVNIQYRLPANMPPGEYQVLLNLPDPTTNLHNRPNYSIRLANQKVWEASTGYNSLLQSVIVEPS